AGDCGPPPAMAHAEPLGTSPTGRFPVGSKVTYRCLEGAMRLPGRMDTRQCLPGPRWSELPPLCARGCTTPPRLRFAALSERDQQRNFYPVGITVSYSCRAGYANTTARVPTSTCLPELAWSPAPELCTRKSCGLPAAPPGGRVLPPAELLFGARVPVLCDDG
ncbi:DAF factor, partial [Eudromia elegans]|nr:DAF factor [Eudromia elegans]